MEVELRAVARGNVRSLCELRLGADQQELVAPAAFTIAEGHYEPGALLRAIYAEAEPVGVLLVEFERPAPFLVRFMITEDRQRAGIGSRAVDLLAEELREAGQTELEVCFVPSPGGAEGFWLKCGFVNTGRRNHEGEQIFTRRLNS